MSLLLWSGLAAADGPLLCPDLIKQGWREDGQGRVFLAWELTVAYRADLVTLSRIDDLAAAFERNGMTLAVLLIPTRPMFQPDLSVYDWSTGVSEYRATAGWLRDRGIVVGDMLDAATAETRKGTDVFFRIDAHWSSVGARLGAQSVAEGIRAHPGYRPQQAFTSRPTERVAQPESDIVQRLRGMCHTTVPTEYNQRYESVGAPTSAGLLGDAPPPAAVLLGSSYTNPNFHLGGFLKDALDVDVMEVNIPGGRALSAMATWLRSPDFDLWKPRWVIWELPIQYFYQSSIEESPSMADPQIYRQLIPAVWGVCKTPVVRHTQDVRPGRVEILSAETLRSLDPAAHYLHLQYSSAAVTRFSVRTEYASGVVDVVPIEAYRRIRETGEHFLQFHEYLPGPLGAVSLELPEGAEGTVEVRVCPRS